MTHPCSTAVQVTGAITAKTSSDRTSSLIRSDRPNNTFSTSVLANREVNACNTAARGDKQHLRISSMTALQRVGREYRRDFVKELANCRQTYVDNKLLGRRRVLRFHILDGYTEIVGGFDNRIQAARHGRVPDNHQRCGVSTSTFCVAPRTQCQIAHARMGTTITAATYSC